MKVSNRKVARALRANGASVVVGRPGSKDMSNYWVIGDDGFTSVLNIQTYSVLGYGCINHPDYVATRDRLVQEAKDLLTAAGIEFTQSRTPDQLFLNGYVSSYETRGF